jgi:hypothetical protein
VTPGGGLVVEGVCLQASVQDADEPVRQPPQGVIMFVTFSAELVAAGAGAGRGVQGGEPGALMRDRAVGSAGAARTSISGPGGRPARPAELRGPSCYDRYASETVLC